MESLPLSTKLSASCLSITYSDSTWSQIIVLIQWPSPCMAQVGTLNTITLKSSIKENGFHTFIGEFIFPKKVCILGRKETCLFWKLDTFPGQGRYLSSSTYVTKNSQALVEEILWLASSNSWRSWGPGTGHDCVSGAILGWWKTPGEYQSNHVKGSLLERSLKAESLETQARACVSLQLPTCKEFFLAISSLELKY